MKVVASYSQPMDAQVAASMLRAHGLFVEVRDENLVALNWMNSLAVGGVKVAVPEADYQTARELLKMPTEAEVILRCPHCGSSDTKQRELSVAVALMLLCLPAVLPIPSTKVDCRSCKQTFRYRPKRRGKPEPTDSQS